jgi:hypothetical protein
MNVVRSKTELYTIILVLPVGPPHKTSALKNPTTAFTHLLFVFKASAELFKCSMRALAALSCNDMYWKSKGDCQTGVFNGKERVWIDCWLGILIYF